MPYWYPANADSGALFYSYNIGPLHMIALSAYSDLSEYGPQTVFLKKDLAAINRTLTPWVACVWHPPIYNSNTNHYKQHEGFRKAYEPLFLEYRVNMIFNGHVSLIYLLSNHCHHFNLLTDILFTPPLLSLIGSCLSTNKTCCRLSSY